MTHFGVLLWLSVFGGGATLFADNTPPISGYWLSPGQNLIEIKANSDGVMQGYVVEYRGTGKALFQSGEVVIDKVTFNDNVVSFQSGFRDLDRDPKTCPVHFTEFTGKVSADGETLNGSYANFEFVPTTDKQGNVTGCVAKKKDGTTPYKYSRPPISCADPALHPGFQIIAGTKKSISIQSSNEEPLGDENEALDVLVTTLTGTAVSQAKVSWHVARAGGGPASDYITETDPDGHARLQFVMLPNGDFAPTTQMTRPDITLPVGKYIVQASAPDLNLRLDTALEATLARKGVLVNISDTADATIDRIVLAAENDAAQFSISVIDREDRKEESRPKSVDVSISADGVNPVSVTLPGSGGLYRINKPFTIYRDNFPRGLQDAMSQYSIRVTKDVTEVTVNVTQFTATASIKVYTSKLVYAKAAITSLLEQYEKVVKDVKTSAKSPTDEQRKILDAKLTFIEHARAALTMKQEQATGDVGIAVATGYVGLLKQKIKPADPKPRKYELQVQTTLGLDYPCILPYSFDEEQQMLSGVGRKIRRQHEDLVQAVLNDLAEQLSNGPQMLKVAVSTAIAAPVYSAYVLVFGLTLDGDDADAVDRLFAGLDIAQFVLQSPPSVQVAKRMGWKAEVLKSVKAFANKFGLKLGAPGTPMMAQVDYRIARLVKRMEAEGEAIVTRFDIAKMDAKLKESLRQSLERIADSKVAANLRARLVLEGAMDKVPNIRRDIGFLEHWTKELESKAYWEREIAEGRASGGNGRYRSLVAGEGGAKVPSRHEELVEWTITGSRKRIDTGLVNHEEKTVCILDRAAQLDGDHLAKGTDTNPFSPGSVPTSPNYVALVLKAFPGYTVKYFEYYWDEKSGDFVLGRISRY
jgi:hypothetical protein